MLFKNVFDAERFVDSLLSALGSFDLGLAGLQLDCSLWKCIKAGMEIEKKLIKSVFRTFFFLLTHSEVWRDDVPACHHSVIILSPSTDSSVTESFSSRQPQEAFSKGGNLSLSELDNRFLPCGTLTSSAVFQICLQTLTFFNQQLFKSEEQVKQPDLPNSKTKIKHLGYIL